MNIRMVLVTAFLSFNAFAAEMGPSGGLGGQEFRDPTEYGPITSIKLCGATLVDSITTTYGGYITIKHGGNGGTCSTIDFPAPTFNDPGLSLIKISGCFNGNTINSLTLTRSDGLSLTKGQCKGAEFSYGSDPAHLSPNIIRGFFGRSERLLDSIGVFTGGSYFDPSGPSGSKGGTPFAVRMTGVSSIKVCSGSMIDSITISYTDFTSIKIGGNGGFNCQTENLLWGHQITSIRGYYNMNGVINFSISTPFRNVMFGPVTTGENFKYEGNIRGLIGRSGSRIDAIGVSF